MKVFLFKFNSPMLAEVARNLQKQGIEVSYWAGSKKGFEEASRDKKYFPYTVFHNTFDAVELIPAPGIDALQFDPPGKELLRNLFPCESQVLVMMNSVDPDVNISLSRKKHIYYEYVRYWYGMLDKLKPDALLFSDIPHLAFQFVAYHLAKLMGIRIVMYRAIQVKGRLLFLQDIERYLKVEEEMDAGRRGSHFTLEDLSPDVRAYYDAQVKSQRDPSPFYMKGRYTEDLMRSYVLMPSVSAIGKHVRSGLFFNTMHRYARQFFHKKRIASLDGFYHSGFALRQNLIRWQRMRGHFQKEHARFRQDPDLSQKYIHVSLQNQPECSTSAMGDIFVDQILMIKILSQAMPAGWVLYVKENPLQWIAPRAQTGRYKGYYEEIAKIKNVVLVSTTLSTFELTDNSQAVATVTGTAGWEAVLRGKPALIFGYTWYMYCAGMFRISDTDSCRGALQKISCGYKPCKQEVLRFLAAVDRASVRGYPNKRFKVGHGIEISEEENIKNITGEFLKALKRQHGG